MSQKIVCLLARQFLIPPATVTTTVAEPLRGLCRRKRNCDIMDGYDDGDGGDDGSDDDLYIMVECLPV